ncbi:FMN-binding protein [Natranaerofaba carboxydovora]|uniref:FMN-binding protein n=1 Tax=Natranaerofaba carboxydovora TaxID=2742683 RepID=UPI001F146DBD|nr:FMN-binding protein [Natranaerofaba carboxydovora]UMZ74331.1 FMN-binding domain protein [Natranaerofaba carboxydovora]
MKKIAILAVFALVLGLTSGAMAGYADGTYEGEAEGFNGPVTVEVTVEGGEITAIDATGDDETPDYWEDAQVTVDDIIAAQSTDVDLETGATGSSEGIANAVDNALADAEAEETEEEPAEEPEEEVDEEEEEEELPETGGGVLPILPGIGGLIAAGGALLIAKRK